MNTARSTPAVRALDDTLNGENQLSLIGIDPAGWDEYTLTSAVTENTIRIESSAISRPHCVRAEISMPTAVIQVVMAMKSTPTAVTANVELAAEVQPNSRKKYCPATWARLAITIASAAMMTQPVMKPVWGPKARVTQLKEVPQSGSALFM